jgi:hypothetical protein
MATSERIQDIIDFVSTDAYDEEEVMAGWGVALDSAATRPFPATALGQEVTVLAFESDTRHGLRCEVERETGSPKWIGVDVLDFDSLPEAVQEVLEAFEAWTEGDY